MKKTYQLLILAFIVFLSVGCRSGSSQIVQKDLLPEGDRKNKLYFPLMDFTSLGDVFAQREILSNIIELLETKKLLAQFTDKADYILL